MRLLNDAATPKFSILHKGSGVANKDVYRLRKGSWHYRLQKEKFGKIPYTTNFCPYFWLTLYCLVVKAFDITVKVFCLVGGKIAKICWGIVAAVLYLPYKVGKTVVGWLDQWANMMADLFDTYIYEPWIADKLTKACPEEILELYRVADWQRWETTTNKQQETASKRFEHWKKLEGDDWETKLASLKEQQKRDNEAEEERLAKQKAYQEEIKAKQEASKQAYAAWADKQYLAAIKVAKVVTPVVLGTVALALLYWVYRLFAWVGGWPWGEWFAAIGTSLSTFGTLLWSFITSIDVGAFLANYWLDIVLTAGVVVLGLGLVFLGAYCLKRMGMGIDSFIRKKKAANRQAAVKKPANKVVEFWKKMGSSFGTGVKEFFQMSWRMLVAFKERNCPGIEWIDEEET